MRRSNRCSAPESVARSRVCGERAWSRVGGSAATEDASRGERILAVTWPVEEDAAFNRPSVPAE